MKKTLTIIAFSITGLVTFAQQDAQFSMNMFNRLSVNPAYAGTNKALCATILYRDQWDKFPGAPKTGLLSVDYGQIAHGGIGFTIDQDQLGFDKTLKAKLAYSFHMAIGTSGTLGIGLDAGMINKSLTGNFIAPDGTSTEFGGGTDNAIPWTGTSATTYDVGFGLYYTNDKLYVGLSSLHLPAQKINDKSSAGNTYPLSYDFQYQIARHYYVMAGYDFFLSSKLTLTPSTLIKSDAAVTTFDLNAKLLYDNFIWAGISYRLQDAIAPMIGVAWKPNDKQTIKIGYSYDLGTSDLKAHHSNTHEILLNYCIKWNRPPKIQSHINPRFLK